MAEAETAFVGHRPISSTSMPKVSLYLAKIAKTGLSAFRSHC